MKHRIPRRFPLLAALLLLTHLGCDSDIPVKSGAPGIGRMTVLDTGGKNGDTGWWPSIVLDRNATPHLSYCDAYNGNLMYGTRLPDGTWKTEVVISEGAVGKYTSIAVAPNGTLGLAFYDQDLKYLRYASRAPKGAWQLENVAWGLEIGMASELRFDSHNTAHLFYYLPSGKIAHGTRDEKGTWKKSVIAQSTGGFSVRIDAHIREDGLWLSFVHWAFKDTAMYISHASDPTAHKYDTTLVSEKHGPGWKSQLIFDQAYPSILFSLNRKQSIKWGTRKKDEWTFKTLERHAGNFAARRSANGDVVVALESRETTRLLGGTLKLLKRVGGTWSSHTIDTEGPNASYLSLAVTPDGKPIVAYYSRVIKGLKIYDETLP